MQPTPLAPVPVGVTCFLFPTPDVLLFGKPNGIDLPIPAAVRPFQFQAQAVALSAFAPLLLMVPDSYSVYAH